MFGSTNRGVELRFGGACGGEGLSLAFVLGDGTTGKKKGVASGRASLTKIICVGGIDKSSDCDAVFKAREGREGRVSMYSR